MVGRKAYSVPSLRLSVATVLSAAVSSCVVPSGKVTLIVTIGAYGWAPATVTVSSRMYAIVHPFRIMMTSINACALRIPSWLRDVALFALRRRVHWNPMRLRRLAQGQRQFEHAVAVRRLDLLRVDLFGQR